MSDYKFSEILIRELKPNNWFLCEDKLDSLRKTWEKGEWDRIPPIIITRIGESMALIDGHSRAFVALEKGIKTIRVEFISVEDLGEHRELYLYLHLRGEEEGIMQITDLKKRILSSNDYQKKWINLCETFESKNKMVS